MCRTWRRLPLSPSAIPAFHGSFPASTVVTADSVSAARKVLAGSEPVELVILDLMLPWGDDVNEHARDAKSGGLSLLGKSARIRSSCPSLSLPMQTG